MTDQANIAIEQRLAPAWAVFLKNPAHRQFEQTFTELLDRRRAEVAAGIHREARCIALIGASGSGKTSAVRYLMSHHPGLVLDDSESERLDRQLGGARPRDAEIRGPDDPQCA